MTSPGTPSPARTAPTVDRDSQRASLAKGGALGFVGAVTSAVLGFVLTVVLSRSLGADGAGVVAQATGVFAITMALGKFGLDSTALYLLPRLRLDRPQEVRTTVRLMFAISALISLVLVGLVELAVPHIWASSPADVVASIRAVVLFVPFGALMLVSSGVLRALGSIQQYVLVANITLPALRPAAVAVAALATGSVVVVSVSWALPLVVALLMAVMLIQRPLSDLDAQGAGNPQPRPVSVISRQVVGFAAPRTLSAVLEQCLQWVDLLLIGMLVGSGAAGIYGGATRFIQAGMVVDTALRVVVSPRFSELLHRREHDDLDDVYSTATIWLVLFAAPIYVLLAIFAPVFLALLGPEFVTGANLLAVLAIGCTVTFLAGNIHSLLLMSGRSGWAAINKAIVLALNVTGNLLLLPRVGLIGAAITWACCMLLDAILATIQVRFFVGVRIDLLRPMVPLAVVLLTTGVPALLARHLLGATVTGFLVGTAAAVAAFLIGVFVLRRPLHLDGLLALAKIRRRG